MIRSYIGIWILVAAFWSSMAGCTAIKEIGNMGTGDILASAATILTAYDMFYRPGSRAVIPLDFPPFDIKNDSGDVVFQVVNDMYDLTSWGTDTGQAGNFITLAEFNNLHDNIQSGKCAGGCEIITANGERVKIK